MMLQNVEIVLNDGATARCTPRSMSAARDERRDVWLPAEPGHRLARREIIVDQATPGMSKFAMVP